MRLNPDNAPPAELRRRISALKAELTLHERKRDGITRAIESRRQTLNRLHATLALRESAAAPVEHE